MAMMTDSFGKIRGIASSYLSHPTMMRAKGVASSLARSSHVKSALGGGIVGGLAGAINHTAIRPGESNVDAARRAQAMPISAMKVLRGAATGALVGTAASVGYRGYKSMGGYGGMKAAAMGGVARASRWGSGMMDRAASFINR